MVIMLLARWQANPTPPMQWECCTHPHHTGPQLYQLACTQKMTPVVVVAPAPDFGSGAPPQGLQRSLTAAGGVGEAAENAPQRVQVLLAERVHQAGQPLLRRAQGIPAVALSEVTAGAVEVP